MPIMPRTDKKAIKIVFNILGKPGNMQKSKHKKIKDEPQVRTDAKYDNLVRIIDK